MTNIAFNLLRNIGLTQAIASQCHQYNDDTGLVRVTQVDLTSARVHDGSAEHSARLSPRLRAQLAADGTALAVGDWALTQRSGGTPEIMVRLDPTTHLARRTQDGRRQALASNVDTALLVMGLDHDFNPRRLERYLAMVHAAGVAPVVVLTKSDIGVDVQQRTALLQQRLPTGIPIFSVNALGDEPALVLAPWLACTQTLILLGSSGAGKSTLTNSLTGGQQATGGVRGDDSRGRHTTTARSLHLCPGGACIIDTPGLRALRLDADQAQLGAAFDDIEELARHCQFRDCQHDAEPGCAVRDVVDLDRLRNYHKLLREVRRTTQTPLDRIAERAKWKALMKSVVARNRIKDQTGR
jgi:ribosome biogenesis GTPase